MSGWFTTWTFWVGAVWGFSVACVVLNKLLIRPMARCLGLGGTGTKEGEA